MDYLAPSLYPFFIRYRHDLEHLLIAQIAEKTNLLQRRNPAIGLDKRIANPRLQYFDTNDRCTRLATSVKRILDEIIGHALRLHHAIKLRQMRRILEVLMRPLRTHDDAVARAQIELQRIDFGRPAYPQRARHAQSIRRIRQRTLGFALRSPILIRRMIDRQKPPSIAAQQIHALIPNVRNIRRTIRQIDQIATHHRFRLVRRRHIVEQTTLCPTHRIAQRFHQILARIGVVTRRHLLDALAVRQKRLYHCFTYHLTRALGIRPNPRRQNEKTPRRVDAPAFDILRMCSITATTTRSNPHRESSKNP